MNLAGTIEELKTAAQYLKLPDLRKLIQDLTPESSEVAPYVQFTENHYARNLVYKTPYFEVLVLCWRAGQRSPIHDHGSSICTVYTVDGILSADNYRKTAAGHLRADYSEDFKPGSVLSIQTTEIHQVSNLQNSSDLISLHFYLAPLENNYVYSVMQPTFESYRPGYTRVFMHADGI
jgi:cysteine dioxygenase